MLIIPENCDQVAWLFISLVGWYHNLKGVDWIAAAAATAKSLQSCPTLCDPIDGSPPGSPIPGILQVRTVEWGCHFLLQCMKVKSEREVTQSCPTLSDPMDCSPPGSSVHGTLQARVLEWGVTAFSAPISQILLIHKKLNHFILPLLRMHTVTCGITGNSNLYQQEVFMPVGHIIVRLCTHGFTQSIINQ